MTRKVTCVTKKITYVLKNVTLILFVMRAMHLVALVKYSKTYPSFWLRHTRVKNQRTSWQTTSYFFLIKRKFVCRLLMFVWWLMNDETKVTVIRIEFISDDILWAMLIEKSSRKISFFFGLLVYWWREIIFFYYVVMYKKVFEVLWPLAYFYCYLSLQ